MKIAWHHQALAGLTIALYCKALMWIFGGEGWFTISAFGGDYGLAHLKSYTLVVVGGELFDFPYLTVFYCGGFVGLGIAVAAAVRRFTSRRSNA